LLLKLSKLIPQGNMLECGCWPLSKKSI